MSEPSGARGGFSPWTSPTTDPRASHTIAKNKDIPQGPAPDPAKARKWFDHAASVEVSNHDFAIECYISGLRFAPDSMEHHEKLHEVAIKRKVAGGKPAGIIDAMKRSKGKDPLEKMLNAEYLWAKNPIDPGLAMNVMVAAVAAEHHEVAYWIGSFAIDVNRQAKRPNKNLFLKACDLFAQIHAYEKAVEAGELALQLDPQNAQLNNELKNLQALQTEQKGAYDQADMRQSIVDEGKQRELEAGDQIAASEAAVDQVLSAARENYEANPHDDAAVTRLADALLRRDNDQRENEAIEMLTAAHQETGNYRFKLRVGDVRMKQFNRRIRAVRAKIKEDGETDELRERLRKLRIAQLRFELAEYDERAETYPTDMAIRYELGRRQFEAGDNDGAIASLQQAQEDAKSRAPALRYLGRAFKAKEWHDEAIDTFRRGIDALGGAGGRLSLDLNYELMTALVAKAERDKDAEAADEAAKIASQIAQTDINYRDIRDRVDALRNLSRELAGDDSDA
ncbi:MAG: hypothetical protein CMJ49_08415 [Planctomycetaceae bacterium]|nr:hypothetical protein [Planctomycetaceae bacterium]